MKDVTRSRLLLILIAVIVVAIDQLTKAWIVINLEEYRTVQIADWLKPFLSITPIRNTGGVFGVFPQLGQIFKYLSVFVVIIILFFQRSIPPNQYWIHVSLGIVSGGAISNVIDRLVRGYVIDYFDVNLWPFAAWPIFNIADSAIVIGAAVMLIDAVFSKPEYVVSNA